MLAVKTNRKQPLPASHSSAFNPEKQGQVAGYTCRLEPLRVRFISSDTITVQVNTTHLYTQNCTTRRTPCCSRLPGQISRGHFGSRIERQTRPRSSLPPSSTWRGRKAKMQEGNGEQVLAGASRFLLHPSADWRQRGRQGRSPEASLPLISRQLRDSERAGATGRTTHSQSRGTDSRLHPLYSAQPVLHEKRPHPQGIRSQHHFTTWLMPLTEAGKCN